MSIWELGYDARRDTEFQLIGDERESIEAEAEAHGITHADYAEFEAGWREQARAALKGAE